MLADFYANLTCSPTRAELMSGMDSHRAGLGVMGAPTREDQKGKPGYEGFLNFRVASLADLMTDASYNTYMTGKWHLGSTVETGPRARGFKNAFVSLDGAAHLSGWDWRGPTNGAEYRDGDELVSGGRRLVFRRSSIPSACCNTSRKTAPTASPSSPTSPTPAPHWRCRRRDAIHREIQG